MIETMCCGADSTAFETGNTRCNGCANLVDDGGFPIGATLIDGVLDMAAIKVA